MHPKIATNMLVCRVSTRRRVNIPHVTRSSVKLSENIRCLPPHPKLNNGLYSPFTKCGVSRGRNASSPPNIKRESPTLSIPTEDEAEEAPAEEDLEHPPSLFEHQEVPIGPDHQVSALPTCSSEPCKCRDRGEALVRLTTEEEVAAALKVEKDAAEAWMAYKAQARAQLEPSAPTETLGKRMRLKTPKAEALTSNKCPKQEPTSRSKDAVRLERPRSRQSPPLQKDSVEAVASSGTKAAKAASRPAAKAASKAGTTSDCSTDAMADEDATAAALLQLADVSGVAAAAVDSAEAAKAIKRAKAAARRERRKLLEAEKAVQQEPPDSQGSQGEEESSSTAPPCAILPSMTGDAASMQHREQMLWDVVASPLMMRDFSKVVAAQLLQPRPAAPDPPPPAAIDLQTTARAHAVGLLSM
mmetsp:Transcript_34737/g.69190  ORF Transcript_34737/g.69190 Transcript_34737/m.69190 type:complete len:414 (-) Transcript_34737:502-1743(-)